MIQVHVLLPRNVQLLAQLLDLGPKLLLLLQAPAAPHGSQVGLLGRDKILELSDLVLVLLHEREGLVAPLAQGACPLAILLLKTSSELLADLADLVLDNYGVVPELL